MYKPSDTKTKAMEVAVVVGAVTKAIVLGCALGLSVGAVAVSENQLQAQQKPAASEATQTSSIEGRVVTANGQKMANAEIILEGLDTGTTLKTSSNEAGAFSFNRIPAGQYRLMAVKDHYKKFVIRTMPLMAGDTVKATVVMQEGNASEVVIGSAESVVSSNGAMLAGKELKDIPQNQRNFINVAQMSAGANEGNTNGGASSNSKAGAQHDSSSVSVGGQLELLNNFEIDGMDNIMYTNGFVSVHPSMEAMGGMQVMGSAYTAAEGRSPGGVINMMSKAGEKQYHGSIFEFFRNDALDSYPYLFGATSTRKPEVRQNQFGFNLGGPMGKRTVFFGDYEAFRLIQAKSPASYSVPSASYARNAAGALAYMQDQYKAAGFSTAQIPTAVDKAGEFYYELLPMPNAGNTQYVASPSGRNNSYAFDVRVDFNPTEKDALFGRVSFNHEVLTTPGTFPAITPADFSSVGSVDPVGNLYAISGSGTNKGINIVLHEAHSFSADKVLKLAASYTMYDGRMFPLNYGKNLNEEIGQPNVNLPESSVAYSHGSGLAPLNVVNEGAQLGNSGWNFPNIQTVASFNLKGSYEWTIGRHALSFGGGSVRRYWTDDAGSNVLGEWTIPNYAMMIAGETMGVSRMVNLVVPHYRLWESNGWAQDAIKVTPKLTATVGLRYDVFTQPVELNNALSNFDINTGTILVAGSNGVSRSADVNTDHGGLAPRFGFNYQLSGDTTLHGGYGLVFAPQSTTGQYEAYPFTYSYSTSCNAMARWMSQGSYSCTTGSTYAYLVQGEEAAPDNDSTLISDLTHPGGVFLGARAKNYKSMQMHQYNVGVDHTFGRSDQLTLIYVGSVGHHLTRIFPDGLYANGTVRNASNLSKLSYVTYWDAEGDSNYNALQASYHHQMKFNLNGVLNYTYAHSLDNARPWNMDYSGFGAEVGVDPNFLASTSKYDYGNSTFDVRQHVSGMLMYMPKWGEHGSRSAQILEKGWEFNLTEVWGNGLPFTVVNSTYINDASLTSFGYGDRPNMVAGQKVVYSNPSVKKYFNSDAFVQESTGTLGTEGRNQYRGPNSRHTDFAMTKNFDLRDKTTAVFRAEVFNITNTANFASPANVVGQSTFGQLTQITMGYTPREIQISLRVKF